MNELIIEPTAWLTMKEDAEARYPNECCGFFYGSNAPKVVKEALVIKNSSEGDQRRRFEISPNDYFKGEKYALENNLELLGIYHSHPDHPARPSEHDRVQAVPVFSYIILSIVNGGVTKATSWLLNNKDQFENEKLTINE
ncbi:MAG: M67 family metallopeptidase [Bacteroidota bacterium]